MDLAKYRELFWKDKKSVEEFLVEPLNKELYRVYLSIKRYSSPQDSTILKLFNEVYYICSRVVNEINSEPQLEDYIKEIKSSLGWDFSSSIALQMVYAVLALRKGNTTKEYFFVQQIAKHYRMDERLTPFGILVQKAKEKGLTYQVDFMNINMPNLVLDIDLNTKSAESHPIIQIQNAEIHVESSGNYIAKQILTK